MSHKTTLATLAALLFTAAGSVAAEMADITKMTPEEAAEYLVFAPDGFYQDQKTQEGTTGRDRLTQDEIQKTCTAVTRSGKPIDAKTAERVRSLAQATIKYPEGGIRLGDWKKGRTLAWSGWGFRTAHKPDNHAKREPGGNCYNCHALAPDRTGGTIGPSLTGFGKTRGDDMVVQKYVYDMIYNPHALFPCTNMPRFGAKGTLTEQQIADLMAYLLDLESLVNQ